MNIPRNFTSEFATELAELSHSFTEVAQNLQVLQELLEEGNNQTKAILDTLPLPILVVESPSGNTFYVNKRGQELVGTSDVLHLPLDNYQMYISATGELCPIEKRPLRRTLQGETVYEDQLEWRIGERILPLEIWTKPIYDHQGNIIFAISIFQDSSQRKQAEKVLAETVSKQTELDAARHIQMGLYPSINPDFEHFELASYCHPSLSVGGDLYDYYPHPDDHQKQQWIITLADVMGKGMSAALLATSFRASLRITSQQMSPGKAIAATANAMSQDLDRSESYITCVHGYLDIMKRELIYVNAGHGHGFLLRANGEMEKLGKSSSPISPWFTELLQMTGKGFTEHCYHFQPGDLFLLYSDGLIDCKPELELTPEKIAHLIAHHQGAKSVIDQLKSVAEVQENTIDDLTLIALYCHG